MIAKIKEIRKEAEEVIKAILAKNNLERLDLSDLDCGSCSPVIQEDAFDANNNFTLDSVSIENGELSFDGSSSCDNSWWNTNSISTDALVNIACFMENHEEEIEDYAKEINE